MHPVRRLFKSMPIPRDAIADLLFHESPGEEPDFWTVRVYRDDFDPRSPEDKLVIHNWISDVIRTIRMVEPHIYLEVEQTPPGGNNGR